VRLSGLQAKIQVLSSRDIATHKLGPVPPPASDPDELWRQAAKARIRERILREEAELEALEAQVRRELMEERTRLLRSGLGRSAGSGAALGSAPTPAPSGTQTRIELKVCSSRHLIRFV
jgi:hypothetical protein